MKLLAIDTSNTACSVALAIEDQIIERTILAPREHTRLILPMIEELLRDSDVLLKDLHGLAFGCGPGSFTGIRIATGVIQGLAYGLQLPVVPISTLSALAQQFFNENAENIVFTALDARLHEVFWGVYQRSAEGFAELIGEESVVPPHAVNSLGYQATGIGSAWDVYLEELQTCLGANLLAYQNTYMPTAKTIAQLAVVQWQQGHTVTADQVLPTYLRNKVAKTTAEQTQS